ncbi:hypothetical protein [Algicola sagamiensis]|uniref:hypothetical protein n=1 Tax=Algicola sagamiensis TaxID=163869 RepID=UPI00037A6FC7|nr:hypothetical protein [Algicola sagamiensis]
MESITLVLSLSSMIGLDKKITRWVGLNNGKAIVDAVFGIAKEVTGESTPELAKKKLEGDTESLIAFEEMMHDREAEMEKMAYQGWTDSIAVQQEDRFSKWFIYLFAMGWSVFAFLYLFLVTFSELPAQNIRFADTVLGFLLGTVLAGIFGFFYGSSASQEK